MKDRAPTVFAVDDEPATLKAIARLLRAAGWTVAPYASPAEFLERVDPDAPGCLVLDMSMPGMTGLEVQLALEARGVALPVVFLTGRADVPSSVKAMKRGAADFLTKPVDERDLLAAIERSVEKDAAARRDRAEVAEITERLATLTPREREVLARVISGKLNKQIAADLGTVEKTVKVHRGRVMAKMNASSVADLVRLAERAGVRRA
ncbi:MAG TPA: response regulator [Thermoanaerobaculia bacterium]|nr:response regulator [Thermoanaerobaculia bacterium]